MGGGGQCVCVVLQAEDGIRDATVTGVQTCALPISYGTFPRVLGHYAREQKLFPLETDRKSVVEGKRVDFGGRRIIKKKKKKKTRKQSRRSGTTHSRHNTTAN